MGVPADEPFPGETPFIDLDTHQAGPSIDFDAHQAGPSIGFDDDQADQQWELLKTAIPGYESPGDRTRRLRQEELVKSQNERVTVMSSASSRTDDTAQRCHSCGWVGVPKFRQRCPECDGRDILSEAFIEPSIDLNIDQANVHDHDHDHDHDHNNNHDHDRECGDARSQPGERAGLCRVKATHVHDHNHDHDLQLNHDHDHEPVMPIEYEDDDDDLVMELEEEVEVHVALDTGSVAHCVGPKDIPGSIRVKPPASGKIRNFVGAGGDGIKNHGEALVQLVQEDGTIINSMFQVADVVRPPHSASQICDGTEEKHHEVLFTREAAHVVPEGTLSRLLATINVIAKYPRRGGLYVAKMKARRPRPKPSPSASRSSFARPGRRS